VRDGDHHRGVIPDDGPLGLPHAAMRPYAVILLCVCAALAAAVAFRDPRLHRRRPLPAWLPILIVALAVRALASLAVDGQTFDVLVAYRDIGDSLFSGRDIWSGSTRGLATYPPTLYVWWAIAGLVPADHPHIFAALVRAPFWIADAGIAIVLLHAVGGDRGRRAAWMYALCPVAIAVPTLHGQADPVVDLLLVVAVIMAMRGRSIASGVATGLAVAVKQWPLFFVPALLASTPRRRVVAVLATIAAPALAAYAAYAVVHPADAVRGVADVATYRPHRAGLGTALLFPLPAGPITAINIAVLLLGATLGVYAVRAGRTIAEAMALDMLVVVGLSPTAYDQYLMWAFPLLLLAGRLRTAALLGVGLLPAVLSLDLWTSQGDGDTPNILLILSTLSLIAAALSLLPWRRLCEPVRPHTHVPAPASRPG
jgi:hypothetical protein